MFPADTTNMISQMHQRTEAVLLTPDTELNVPFKVSVGEGGYVALVDAFVRHLRLWDEQS